VEVSEVNSSQHVWDHKRFDSPNGIACLIKFGS
jgi:hypothetical protein